MATNRPLSFVLAASDQGTFIVSRNDYRGADPANAIGVGHQILANAGYDQYEINIVLAMLNWLREFRGDGVIALDCGANIGVHTVSFARHMTGWGRVAAFEAQERIFYALAGNICLNNLLNARAFNAAVGDTDGSLAIPTPDYNRPGSFGSLELIPGERTENIGQPIDYRPEAMRPVRLMRLDSMGFPRVDLMKIDIEGMEIAALNGAVDILTRFRPYLVIEHIKTDRQALTALLEGLGYRIWSMGMNTVALPADDPCVDRIRTTE